MLMKTLFSICISIFFAFFLFLPGVRAQPAKVIKGGILNGKASRPAKPEYPEAARLSGIGGQIGVNVTIDETGKVIAAEAEPFDQRERKSEDGAKLDSVPVDPSLSEAAVDAAWKTKFPPTLLRGEPVKITGKLIYNFDPKSGQDALIGDSKTEMKGVNIDGQSLGRTVSGGVLNGKATSLPKPEYPATARAVRAGGTVMVKITIGEDGSVVAAEAVSGHPLLQAAATAAAREAKFSPTLLNGQPVKVSSILTYNFVPSPPKKDDQ